jgi:hypothetical protein
MSQLVGLQNAIIGRLTMADPNIPSLVPHAGQINWMTENIGDLGSNIAKVIGQMGIVGIVTTPGGGKVFQQGIYPAAFRCTVEIQLQENVTINRGAAGTQIASLDLLEFVIKRLHLFSPHGHKSDRVELDETPFHLVADTPLLVYNVRFVAPITLGK